ncbi:ABC transporter permease [Brevibacterium otitidis]|uniref:ABC transporter permease n=1 Tax=Brevibacterium otitidis TaxID=53364 RepID=A0ABV5WZU2_9MICO|nr:ABC transporter permease [Brevibacterium otitidis]
MRAISLEFRKMRRLRTFLITGILILAVAGLSSFSLFSGSTQETFNDPAAAPWAGLMVTYTLMAAMTSPILAAVLASRQTDIEHSGIGWTLASTAGLSPGALCRAKLAALSAVLFAAVLVQSLLVIGIGLFAGIRVPLDPGPWIAYTALLFFIDVAFLALHIWLAAIVENQLVSVGVGMLGAFLGVFCILTGATVARVIPWGYYAMISPIGQQGDNLVTLTPPLGWIAGFLALVGAFFVLVTHRLDRLER